MTIHIVKCIICAIALGVLCGVIGYRNHRKPAVSSKKQNDTQNDTQYVVGVPSALKYVYMAMFMLGIGLFLIFLVFKVSGNESVTMGHLYFSLVFAGIGLLVMIWASRWSILVKESKMELRRMFHKRAELFIQDIGKVEIGKKDAMILYDKVGRKLITIDGLSENYDRFARSLQLNGKIK